MKTLIKSVLSVVLVSGFAISGNAFADSIHAALEQQSSKDNSPSSLSLNNQVKDAWTIQDYVNKQQAENEVRESLAVSTRFSKKGVYQSL